MKKILVVFLMSFLSVINVVAAESKFSVGGSMDLKVYDVRSYDFAGTNQVFSLYPTYGFYANANFGDITGYLDIKKPGYASATYPWLKINQLYIKYTKDIDASNAISTTLGRQIVGDAQDLFLGFEGETIRGDYFYKKFNMELMVFGSRVDITRTQAYTGLLGIVPSFKGSNTTFSLYLLSAVADGPYAFVIGSGIKGDIKPMEEVNIFYRIQAGGEIGNNSVSGFGSKADGRTEFGKKEDALGFGSTIAFTTGANADGTSTGFASPNILTGAGPGLFSKLEGPLGSFTFVDGLTNCTIIPMYAGIFNFGANIDKRIANFITPGLGVNLYSNTAAGGSYLGTELDIYATASITENISAKISDAIFFPGSATFPGGKTANRLELGMLMTF